MKKLYSLIAMVLMAVASASAQTLPITVDEVITEAPQGKVVSNGVRSCYSYFYQYGYVDGGWNGSFNGEYVIGDDGCIYLKQPCASLEYVSYLKLDPVTDEASEHYGEYVCHTAQAAYVYDSGTKVYVYYATRLVLSEVESGGFTWSLETDEDGKYVTDVYFTYQDGVLQQKNQKQVTRDGYTYPYEIIGLTNATGGWAGYGDGCITIKPVTVQPTTLPEGAEVKDGSFAYDYFSTQGKKNVRNAMMTKYAEVGDDYYMLNPLDGKNWLKGSIDRTAGTVTFTKQYAGINESIDCHLWFIPCTVGYVFDLYDEETGYGEWITNTTEIPAYVCKYENGNVISDPDNKQAMVFSRSEESIERSGIYCNFSVKAYEDKLAKPANPSVLKFEPFEETGMWGELSLHISPVDENDTYINKEELYYNVYLGDATNPYTFTTKEFGMLPEDMVDMPYLYKDDWDFDIKNGATHNIFFYKEGIKFAGVQTLHKKNGEVAKSDIVWYNYDPTGIKVVEPTMTRREGKVLENGRIVILKNGQKYNLNGQAIK